ncbi:Hypothetical protein D9617_23g005130 [Elsinoe fawcettii]|nr:Hypothetical protein D9617_23g005130 [Elsinoe fawcettii]
MVSDSSEVVECMVRLVFDYMKNGGVSNGRGKPIANFARIKGVYRRVVRMETDLGITVKFWKVLREYNMGADHLSTQAVTTMTR